MDGVCVGCVGCVGGRVTFHTHAHARTHTRTQCGGAVWLTDFAEERTDGRTHTTNKQLERMTMKEGTIVGCCWFVCRSLCLRA